MYSLLKAYSGCCGPKLLLLWIATFAVLQCTAQQQVVVGRITVEGNRKTGNEIVFRELLFHQGDTLTAADLGQRIRQSHLNLLNTSLFNYATLDTLPAAHGSGLPVFDIAVKVIERWYVWPVPSFQLADRNFNAWWKERDFSRVTYGANVVWYNFSGRMDQVQFSFKAGKSRSFGLTYSNPYIDRHKRIGLGFTMGYTEKREAGVLTVNDRLFYIAYEKGVASEQSAAFSLTYRRGIFTTHQLAVGIRNLHFADTLLKANRQYSYEGLFDPSFLTLHYKLKIDHRDIKYYPLSGWYADLELHKDGFGSKWEKPVNSYMAKTTLRYFSKFSNRLYSGIALIGKVTAPVAQPYFLQSGIGFSDDFVRGYEYNVIDGGAFVIGRSSLKYALLPQRDIDLKFIPTTKFSKTFLAVYLTAFADAGYVWKYRETDITSNRLPNTLLGGTGLGLDFVTYYDKVVRVEYSVNRSGKSGIFIQFVSGF